MRFKLSTLLLLTTAAAISIAAVRAYCLYYPSQAHHASAAVANRVLWKELSLPASASDATFFVDQYGCEAEFAISERELLEWCESRHWTLSQIQSPVPYFRPIILPDDGRLVTDGWQFTSRDCTGVYDCLRGRAAYSASTFP